MKAYSFVNQKMPYCNFKKIPKSCPIFQTFGHSIYDDSGRRYKTIREHKDIIGFCKSLGMNAHYYGEKESNSRHDIYDRNKQPLLEIMDCPEFDEDYAILRNKNICA